MHSMTNNFHPRTTCLETGVNKGVSFIKVIKVLLVGRMEGNVSLVLNRIYVVKTSSLVSLRSYLLLLFF